MSIKPNSPPKLSDIPPGMTTGELANLIYPHIPYDTALPQPWVDECQRQDFDPRGQFVWGYPEGNVIGQPLPLTAEAAQDVPARQIW